MMATDWWRWRGSMLRRRSRKAKRRRCLRKGMGKRRRRRFRLANYFGECAGLGSLIRGSGIFKLVQVVNAAPHDRWKSPLALIIRKGASRVEIKRNDHRMERWPAEQQ